jgi:hypothetical protein
MSTEKTPYEIYRERVKEGATKLDRVPKEIGQHILWLKSMAIHRIEEIDNELNDEINTFRALDGKEVSLTQAMNAEKEGRSYKFGFTEMYVNLLMHYAYEAGKKSREEDFKRTTERMDRALKEITNILDGAGYIEYPED